MAGLALSLSVVFLTIEFMFNYQLISPVSLAKWTLSPLWLCLFQRPTLQHSMALCDKQIHDFVTVRSAEGLAEFMHAKEQNKKQEHDPALRQNTVQLSSYP